MAVALVVLGPWVGTALTGAAAPVADVVDDVELVAADRGTSVQVEPTQPPPTVYPSDTGSGRRAIFSLSQQRVWVVEADGSLTRTFLVSGRTNTPTIGVHKVWTDSYWRSQFTCSSDHPSICMRYMVRFTKGPNGGNIGFHEIPRDYSKPGNPWVQTEAQLGQPISDGCLRLATADAQFMWGWLQKGTTIVVIW